MKLTSSCTQDVKGRGRYRIEQRPPRFGTCASLNRNFSYVTLPQKLINADNLPTMAAGNAYSFSGGGSSICDE